MLTHRSDLFYNTQRHYSLLIRSIITVNKTRDRIRCYSRIICHPIEKEKEQNIIFTLLNYIKIKDLSPEYVFLHLILLQFCSLNRCM